MRAGYRRSDVFALLVLLVFPLIAYLEPLLEHRLLGPGDGVALHLPLRVEAFKAYRSFSLPFLNTREFLGTPLLAAYRGGVLYPLTFALAWFDPFSAFQALVLISLSLAGVLTYLYLKRLGAGAAGAFVGALSFAYGPYLLSHFEDTATLVAAPMLPLVLLAAESHMNRATPARLLGLAFSVALLVLAGSPEALRAGGALLFGRLLLGHALGGPRAPSRLSTVVAVALGVALSAPQWLPTLQLLPEAGRQVTGLSAESMAGVSGLAGLILKTVTHTPAASLALASLPLLMDRLPIRVLLVAVLASLALQVGRGPLLAPGALPLVLEFALAALAGLALDEQWRERRTRRGRRLRAYFLVASLASVGVLSVAATALGGLPDRLAAAVGVYAIALITYFALADAQSDVAAGVFLLPLAVSFALQPTSREVFKGAPTRSQLVGGTPARRAVDLVLEQIGTEPRVLTLVRSFPADLALDLGFAGYGALAPRVQANGYDPMAPLSLRRNLGEFGAQGFLTEKSLTPDPALLRQWAIDAIQIPTDELLALDQDDVFDLSLEPGSRHVFALPLMRLKSITLSLDPGLTGSLNILARVGDGREVPIGSLAKSPGVAILPSPPYRADAVIIEVPDHAEAAAMRLQGVAVETIEGTTLRASRLSAYLSQPDFQEIAATPQIRLFRLKDARTLVSGRSAHPRQRGPDPGGHFDFENKPGEDADVAIPFLEGWSGNAPVSDRGGMIRVEAPARSLIRLDYVPPLFRVGLFLSLLGLFCAGWLMVRPALVWRLLQTRRDEGK